MNMNQTVNQPLQGMMPNANQPYYIAAIDGGNGYVKAQIDNSSMVYPSVAAKLYDTTSIVPLKDDAIDGFMQDVFNNMDVSFTSPLIQQNTRRLFGNRALKSGASLEEFNVFDNTSKASVDLLGALLLGTMASHALKEHYNRFKTLPYKEGLRVRVDLATALPISEFKRHGMEFTEKLLNGQNPHIVTFHNFEYAVQVEIVIEYTRVLSEGEAAQYGLMFANDDLLNRMMEDLRAHYQDDAMLEGVTAIDLVTSPNTLGIDIGEGTIDFPVFTNRKFNTDASTTMTKGYGSVLEASLDRVQREGLPYTSRKELSELLNSTVSALQRARFEKVRSYVYEEEVRFADEVAREVSKVFNKVGASTEVIFIYGGGATPLQHVLRDRIHHALQDFGSAYVPVVYLDSSFSRYLNMFGLMEMASRLRNV